jgi:hypothetical protein
VRILTSDLLDRRFLGRDGTDPFVNRIRVLAFTGMVRGGSGVEIDVNLPLAYGFVLGIYYYVSIDALGMEIRSAIGNPYVYQYERPVDMTSEFLTHSVRKVLNRFYQRIDRMPLFKLRILISLICGYFQERTYDLWNRHRTETAS